MDGKYNKEEALRMVNTRRQGIEDECNEKTRSIFHSKRNNLSQYNKQCIMDYSFMQTR
jgi:hypothetical protein